MGMRMRMRISPCVMHINPEARPWKYWGKDNLCTPPSIFHFPFHFHLLSWQLWLGSLFLLLFFILIMKAHLVNGKFIWLIFRFRLVFLFLCLDFLPFLQYYFSCHLRILRGARGRIGCEMWCLISFYAVAGWLWRWSWDPHDDVNENGKNGERFGETKFPWGGFFWLGL